MEAATTIRHAFTLGELLDEGTKEMRDLTRDPSLTLRIAVDPETGDPRGLLFDPGPLVQHAADSIVLGPGGRGGDLCVGLAEPQDDVLVSFGAYQYGVLDNAEYMSVDAGGPIGTVLAFALEIACARLGGGVVHDDEGWVCRSDEPHELEPSLVHDRLCGEEPGESLIATCRAILSRAERWTRATA